MRAVLRSDAILMEVRVGGKVSDKRRFAMSFVALVALDAGVATAADAGVAGWFPSIRFESGTYAAYAEQSLYL
jgi:hypothetical protein